MKYSLPMRLGLSLKALLLVSTAVAAEASLPGLCAPCHFEKVATCGGFLEGLTVSPDGDVWLLDVPGDRILSITENGDCLEHAKTGGAPNGARFRPDGRLVIAGSQSLMLFDPKTGELTVLADHYDGTAFTALNDLVLDAKGGVYFTMPGASNVHQAVGRVLYLPAGEAEPVLVSDQLAFPNGIALSADGRNVLVAEFAAKRVVSLPAVGIEFRALTSVYARTTGGIGPDGILVDQMGRLFTANLGARAIQVFAPDSTPVGTIPLPDAAGSLTANLAIHDSHLYVVEGQKGEVWRIKLDE